MSHRGQLEELAALVRILEAVGHTAASAPAAPWLSVEMAEALADLLRRVVWADARDQDDGSDAGGSPLAALLAGKLGATVNAARLEIGLRLVQLLGHATTTTDPALVAALQRAQLVQTVLGACPRVGGRPVAPLRLIVLCACSCRAAEGSAHDGASCACDDPGGSGSGGPGASPWPTARPGAAAGQPGLPSAHRASTGTSRPSPPQLPPTTLMAAAPTTRARRLWRATACRCCWITARTTTVILV
jgi:hypothetical protein